MAAASGRMLRNFASLGVSRVLMRGANGLAGIIVARHLGADGYGHWAAALGFATVAVVFTDLGAAQLLVREGARASRDLPRTVGNVVILKVLLLALVYPTMLAASHLLGHPPVLTATIAVLGGGILLQSVSQIPIALFQSQERMHLTALVQTVLATGYLLGVAGASLAGASLLQVAAVPGVVSLLVLPWILLGSLAAVGPRPAPRRLGRLVRAALPFGLANLFFLLNAQAAFLVMGGRVDAEQVGLYAAAAKLVALLYFVPNVVASVVYPVLFRTAGEDAGRHREASRAVLRWVSLFGLGASGVLALAAEPILGLLYGAEYTAGASFLRILAWVLALQCVSYPLGDALTTTDHQGARVRSAALVALLNLGAAYWVSGRWGAEGVVWVTLGAEGLLALLYAAQVRRRLGGYRPVRTILPQAGAAALALGAGLAIRSWIPVPAPWNQILGVAGFAVVGLAALAPLGFFERLDRHLLDAVRPARRRDTGAESSRPG